MIKLKRLKEVRKQQKVTQFELAKAINIHPQRISEIEHGKGDMRFHEAIATALFLNVSLDYLAGLSGNPSMNTE